MRIERLELTRYGRFTDRVLDFGAPGPGQPDLHIIHGPNEAGKSTLLSAWLDLLFGIPARSPYNFLHSYDAMRIGAVLTLPGGPQQLIRTKGNRNTLTGGDSRPLPETVLQSALGGLDRKSCADMFALDAETMETGGESILSSQGDLGELLFAATAGLSDLSTRLDSLRGDGDNFWKKRARSGRLKELRDELAAIDDQRRALDVQAPEYARRRAAAETARSERDRLLAQAGSATVERDRAQAMLAALPVLAEWRGVSGQLAELGDLPDAPSDWAGRVAQLRRDDVALTTKSGSIAHRIVQLEAALNGLVSDDAALAQAEAEGFDEELKARFLNARLDLPRRHGALAQLNRQLAELSAQTGIGADMTPLPAGTLDTLDALAAEYATLTERLRGAEAEARQAAEALDAAGGPLAEVGEEPAITALRAALDPLRKADLAARRDAALADAAEAAARRDAAIARLAPWQGDLATLRDMPVPPSETLAGWRARLDTARATHDNARRLAGDRQAEARRRAVERDALGGALGGGAPDTVARARADRDSAWADHRAKMDVASADRFAAAMAAHDRAVETQLAHAADLGRLRVLTVDAAAAEQLAVDAGRAATEAGSALQSLSAELAAATRFLPGGDPGDPLAGIADWLAARRAALDLADAAETAARAARRAEVEADGVRAALAAALGSDGALPALAAEAQARLGLLEAEAAARAERRRLTAELAQRRRAITSAAEALEGWTAKLRTALKGTALEVAPPDPAQLRALLPALRGQTSAAASAAEMAHRIETMEADERRFSDAVAALADALNLPEAESLARHAAAVQRLEAARRIADQRAAVERDLAQARQDAAAAEDDRNRHIAEASAITRHLGAADLAEAEAILTRIARRDALLRDADRLASQLLGGLGAPSVEAAKAMLAETTPDALREKQAAADARREDAEMHLELARRSLFEAEQALNAVPGDEQVALLDARRQALLLTIADEARGWLRQRAGVLATQQALDVYRTTHRGGMMARASDAFSTITGGAYAGLAAQPADDGTERLIALAADGGSKAPKELSKGTRFQLYLALRIAGFHEWTAAHGPVPVIADDIMETFDDTRTRLALTALADMSRSAQVIYLTHHRHVCDLAREACPAARITELQP